MGNDQKLEQFNTELEALLAKYQYTMTAEAKIVVNNIVPPLTPVQNPVPEIKEELPEPAPVPTPEENKDGE